MVKKRSTKALETRRRNEELLRQQDVRLRRQATKRRQQELARRWTEVPNANYATMHRAASNDGAELSRAEKNCLGIIIVSTLCVITATLTVLLFDPQKQMERALVQVAQDYYTTYLYPQVAEAQSAAAVMADYAEDGLPAVRLRQLLLYDTEVQAKYAGDFNNTYLKCDTNSSLVKFYPVEPYGAQDYRLVTDMECEDLRN